MARVLAGRGRAIMTGGAVRRHTGVIEAGRRRPSSRGMAELTIIARQDMRRVLSTRDRTVVACRTVRGHESMIESRTFPASRPMTFGALVRTLNVRCVLRRSHLSDMTGFTIFAD